MGIAPIDVAGSPRPAIHDHICFARLAWSITDINKLRHIEDVPDIPG